MANGTRPGVLVSVLLAMALLFALTSLLAKAYHSELRNLAETHFRRGEELARLGKNAEAVEQYRAALSFSHNENTYRLALALALVDLNRLNEAEAHLIELRQSNPNNSVVNLALGRIAARQGRTEEAVTDYHRAVYGLWPDDPEKNRLEARFELVGLLAKRGDQKQVLAELLEMAGEAPDDPAIKDRIGSLLLQFGSPGHAAEIFQDVAKANPRDGSAWMGLGEAQFTLGNFPAAQSAFRRALRSEAGQEQARSRLEEVNSIIALDPTLLSLSPRQRYQRGRELLHRTLSGLVHCVTASGKALPSETVSLADEAHRLLNSRNARRLEEKLPEFISMAEQLWRNRLDLCGEPPASEQPLAIVMTRLSK